MLILQENSDGYKIRGTTDFSLDIQDTIYLK